MKLGSILGLPSNKFKEGEWKRTVENLGGREEYSCLRHSISLLFRDSE